MERRIKVDIFLSHGMTKDFIDVTVDEGKDGTILTLGHAEPKAALDAIHSALKATLLR